MKKKDMILIGTILFLAICFYVLVNLIQKQSTSEPVVVITVKGVQQGTYSLKENQKIYIPGKDKASNVLQIQNGKVRMLEADCPDQICVNHPAIQYNGETIVCLPNEIVAEIKSGEKANVDGGTN